MFIGPTGSGKTSLMYRMLGRRRILPTSTGVADDVVIVNVDTNNPTTMQPVIVHDFNTWERGELDVSLVRQMESKTPSQSHLNSTALHSQRHPMNLPTTSFPEPAIASPAQQKVSKSTDKVKSKSALKIKPPICKYMRKTITTAVRKQGGYQKFTKSLLSNPYSLYMRDVGGQVEFQEIVTLFVFGPAIFIFVFRADLDFKSKLTVEYRKSASESINHYLSSITTEESLLQCLASVYAMGTQGKVQASVKVHQPLVFIVATHKDKLGPLADQKIKELNENVSSLISSNGFQNLVLYANRDKGQVIFAVDNISKSDNDFKVIRSKVHSLISSREEFTIEYPLSYLLFCLDLQNDKRTTLTIDECRVVAAKYGIEGDQVFHLLHFLHLRIGVIQFIDIKGVRCIVLKEPQLLFNKVTDLIVRTFNNDALSMREADDFEKKGILTASAFESVISSNDFITPKEFLQILVHLRIIAPFKARGDQEERYFIPFVLNHVSESPGEDRETDVAPLAVRFKCKHCPKGLFGVLVTHLMTHGEDNPPTFMLNEERIFKDQVSFEVHSPGMHDEISLKYHFSHFEVRFFPEQVLPASEQRESSVNQVCNSIREAIKTSIVSSLQDLHYNEANVEPVMCMRCDACSDLHPVEKGKVCRIHCRKGGVKTVYRIPPNGRCWYNEGTQVSSYCR